MILLSDDRSSVVYFWSTLSYFHRFSLQKMHSKLIKFTPFTLINLPKTKKIIKILLDWIVLWYQCKWIDCFEKLELKKSWMKKVDKNLIFNELSASNFSVYTLLQLKTRENRSREIKMTKVKSKLTTSSKSPCAVLLLLSIWLDIFGQIATARSFAKRIIQIWLLDSSNQGRIWQVIFFKSRKIVY